MFLKTRFPDGEKVFRVDEETYKAIKMKSLKKGISLGDELRQGYREYKKYEVEYGGD